MGQTKKALKKQMSAARHKQNKDLFVIERMNTAKEEEMKETWQRLKQQKSSVIDIDFRSEGQIDELERRMKPRKRINSDSSYSSSDEDLKEAKRVIYKDNSIRKTVEIEDDFASESEY